MISELTTAVDFIRTRTDLKPKIGLTLGSGLNSMVNTMKIETEIPFSEIPGFPQTTVEGHKGKLIFGKIGAIPVVALQGRIHYYEGYSMNEVVFPTRVLALLGIETLVLTNSSGGIQPSMRPGDFMIINDHINLFGDHPLKGPNVDKFGPRFPDMTYAYDPKLIEKMRTLFKELQIRFHEGVYCGVTGPTYETPAEIRYLRTIGGSAVGMSTVPECIAANHFGLKVAGISCITNLAAGITGEKLNHKEVQDVAAQVEAQFSSFLMRFITELNH